MEIAELLEFCKEFDIGDKILNVVIIILYLCGKEKTAEKIQAKKEKTAEKIQAKKEKRLKKQKAKTSKAIEKAKAEAQKEVDMEKEINKK